MSIKFDGVQHYKEVMCKDNDYEKVLNMFLNDIGVTTKIRLNDYESLEELKQCVTRECTKKISLMWDNYANFCIEKLNK